MQKGMNQTVAWLVAVVFSVALFGIGAFAISHFQPHDDDAHSLSARDIKHEKADHHEEKAEHPKKVDEKKKDHSGGEVLRPEDVEHHGKPH